MVTGERQEVPGGLDKVVTKIVLGAAKKVGRQKYGYMRSGPLTMCGRFLITYKMMLDCKARGQPPTEALQQRAAELQVNLEEFAQMTVVGLGWEVTRR